jgi:hypothetical protein
MGMESLSGSPSSRMIWKRSLCVRLDGRAGEDVGCSPLLPPFGGEKGGAVVRSLARVGACADEVSFMGVKRNGVPADIGRADGGEGSLARKSSRVCAPSAMDRIWRGP